MNTPGSKPRRTTTSMSDELNAKAPAATPAPIRRPPRYARVERNIRLTDDDRQILREVYRHRFLRTTHIERLLPKRGSKHLQHRLRALFDNGYLDRMREDAPAGVNPPIIYALGNRGADELGVRRTSVDWSDKNRTYGNRQLKHTMLVNEICVAIRWSCFRNEIHFIPQEEILEAAPEETQLVQQPFQWRISVSRRGKATTRETVRPDYIFGLKFPKHPERPGVIRYYMIEADRGTEPQRRSSPRGPYEFRKLESIADKLFLYKETLTAWREGKEVKPFGFTNFFVLVVTDRGAQRVANMVKECKRISAGAGVHSHRFADLASIQDSDILTMPWLTGEGKLQAPVEWLAQPLKTA